MYRTRLLALLIYFRAALFSFKQRADNVMASRRRLSQKRGFYMRLILNVMIALVLTIIGSSVYAGDSIETLIGSLDSETVTPTETKPVTVSKVNYKQQIGNASWYGPRHHGRRTASGKRFNMYALTCAHKTYPFGTKLEVTNLNTNRTVIVTVNDRGPYYGNRVLDLSYSAAKQLDMMKTGHAQVAYRVISEVY